MNTLLIVEDNDFERNALQHYIDWDVLGVRVVDTAYNGRDGLEKARLHQPDIIISDVKMPEMDGIEMAKAIQQFRPNAKFIFSSGHDESQLLREALEIRAYSYLVKPLRQEELLTVIKKILAVSLDEKLSNRRNRKIVEQFQNNLHYLQNRFLEELIAGGQGTEDASGVYARANDVKLLTMGAYKMAVIEIDFAAHAEIAEKTARLNAILSAWRQENDPKDVLFVKDGDSRIVAVLHSLKDESESEQRILRAIEGSISALAAEQGFHYLIAVSDSAPNLTDLGSLYKQCCSALGEKIGLGYGRVVLFEQHRSRIAAVPAPDVRDLKRIVGEIAAAACDGDDCGERVRKLADMMAAEQPTKLDRVQSAMIVLLGGVARRLENVGERIEAIADEETELFRRIIASRTLPDMTACVLRVVEQVASYMARKKLSKEDYIIREILNILNRDFRQPITLAYLSERVYLSPNYLRILFKEKMNVSIQDYLTRLRINKAKELLRQNRLKVHEIGMMVGYENGAYFNLVFKNIVQMTPGEYRNKHLTQVSGA